jgi:hypothetical protein
MAHWQLRHQDEARQWYDRAARWMKYNPAADELTRFRAEADALLSVGDDLLRDRDDFRKLF